MKFSFFQNGLSGSALKTAALVFMAVDHTAAVLVLRLIRSLGGTTSMTYEAYQAFMADYSWLVTLYDWMRLIGRLAFPLFCFLLVQGFLHTRHLLRYAANLGLFAIISEPCFDLALNGTFLETSSQNVFFTLFLGLMTLCLIRQTEVRFPHIPSGTAWLLKLGAVAVGAGAAWLLKTDYSACGVVCISLMYLFRAHRSYSFFLGCIPLVFLSDSQLFSFLDLLPVRAYNGTRGWRVKYFFYAFYPAHLLLLFLICAALNLAPLN